jgi:hypothetical protein
MIPAQSFTLGKAGSATHMATLPRNRDRKTSATTAQPQAAANAGRSEPGDQLDISLPGGKANLASAQPRRPQDQAKPFSPSRYRPPRTSFDRGRGQDKSGHRP